MKIQRQIGNRGFTLVELMIVIVIIGVLAALATFGFMQYVKKSKTAEADEFVKKLSDGSRTYFTSEQKYGGDEVWHSTGTAGYPVPFGQKVYPGGDGWAFTTHSAIPQGGTKAEPTALINALGSSGAPRDKAALKKLQFNVTEPMYFQYSYSTTQAGDDAEAEIKAIADFDPSDTTINHTLAKTMSVSNGDVVSPPPVTTNEFE